jgi:hypothetical protein
MMRHQSKQRATSPQVDDPRPHGRAVKKLAAFLGRSPDTAMAEDLRAFQLHLTATAFSRRPSTRR